MVFSALSNILNVKIDIYFLSGSELKQLKELLITPFSGKTKKNIQILKIDMYYNSLVPVSKSKCAKTTDWPWVNKYTSRDIEELESKVDAIEIWRMKFRKPYQGK